MTVRLHFQYKRYDGKIQDNDCKSSTYMATRLQSCMLSGVTKRNEEGNEAL